MLQNGKWYGGNELVNWFRNRPRQFTHSLHDIKWNHTSEFVRQDCGSSRFRLRFLGDGEVGGGMSNCDLNNCCADCWSSCVRLLTSSPSFADRWSVVDGEIVPAWVCDGAGEELCEAGDELLNTGVAADGAWAGDDGTCKDDVPEPSDTARPSNWIDSVAVVTAFWWSVKHSAMTKGFFD